MSGNNDWINFNYASKHFSMNPIDFKFRNKKESIEHSIEQILKKYDNLYLSLSGGLDSEFAAKCLYDNGVKFTPIIVDYTSNANEKWYAYYWCYEHRIKPIVLKLTQQDVLENFPKISFKYSTAFVSSIDFILEAYVSKMNGKLVTSAAEPFTRLHSFYDNLTIGTSEKLEFKTYDFMLDYHMPNKHAYNFLTYTPDLLYDMIKNIDYKKPVQLAMAEYYGLTPRPKINAISNMLLHGDKMINAMSISNSKHDLLSISLGFKGDFLRKFENHEIIQGTFEKETLCQEL